MTRPDRELIAQVMLFSQGFRTAESLASKIVPFFNLCDEQLSPQPHYDFGLRALKSVLASAGILKRERLQVVRDSGRLRMLEDSQIPSQNKSFRFKELHKPLCRSRWLTTYHS